MKLKDYFSIGFLVVILSLSVVALYDAFIITPNIRAVKIRVVDVDYILSKSEKEVKNGTLSMDIYRRRIAEVEKLVSEYPYILINQYVTIGGTVRPIVFGGINITEDILKHIEVIK